MSNVEITYRFRATDLAPADRPENAAAARERLDAGNRAFARLFATGAQGGEPARLVRDVDPRDIGWDIGLDESTAKRPYAAVLGCADARLPVELIFNEGPNDLFVVRVAGNGLGGDVLGSLLYAAEHLSDHLKAVVVLGHAGCGTMVAAVDAFLTPSNYLPIITTHALRGILDRTLMVIQASANMLVAAHGPSVVDLPGYRLALIEVAVASNVAFTAHVLGREFAARGIDRVGVFFGIYLPRRRQVWAPDPTRIDWGHLAVAPATLEAFQVVGDAMVRSERVASLLAV